jgi:Flp pilus assembly pilin Flp
MTTGVILEETPGGYRRSLLRRENYTMNTLNNAFLRLLTWQAPKIEMSDEKGQTLAEYGLIMAVIAVAVVVTAVTVFRAAIIGAFNSATTCLSGTC